MLLKTRNEILIEQLFVSASHFKKFYLTDKEVAESNLCQLSIERNPSPAKNQTLRSYRVCISPTKQASTALIQIESTLSIVDDYANVSLRRAAINSISFVHSKTID